MARILVVDDDVKMVEVLAALFTNAGHEVHRCHDGVQALEWLERNQADVVVLDLDMPTPGEHVIDVVRRGPRRDTETAVLVITGARTTDSEEAEGLLRGADDYVRKGTSLTVILSRVQSLIRRQRNRPEQHVRVDEFDIRIDLMTDEVTVAGETVALPSKPLKVLSYLLDNPERVVSRDELLSAVWRTNIYQHALDQAIHVLRRSLGHADLIVTVPGRGYRLKRSG